MVRAGHGADSSGIDPDLAWDDEGNCWVHYSRRDPPAAASTTGTGRGPRRPGSDVVRDRAAVPGGAAPVRARRHWYLLIAEGGTERGHAVSIARGPSPTGRGRPSRRTRSSATAAPTDRSRTPATPTSSRRPTGRGGWCCSASGPRGGTPGFHVLGRETFLAPVEWVDGWPVVGDVALEHDRVRPARTCAGSRAPRRLRRPALHPRWIAVRRPPAAMSLADQPGLAALHGGGAALDSPEPVFVGRRQQHLHCRARVLVDPAEPRRPGSPCAWTTAPLRGRCAQRGGRARPDRPARVTAPCRARPARSCSMARRWTIPGGPTACASASGGPRSSPSSTAATSRPRSPAGSLGRVVGMYAVGGTPPSTGSTTRELFPLRRPPRGQADRCPSRPTKSTSP